MLSQVSSLWLGGQPTEVTRPTQMVAMSVRSPSCTRYTVRFTTSDGGATLKISEIAKSVGAVRVSVDFETSASSSISDRAIEACANGTPRTVMSSGDDV